jgi:hypothetical protein
MSTRRGGQATTGELDAVLCHLNVAQGVDAQGRDGQLWIRHSPTQPWMAAVRSPAVLAARAHRQVVTSVAAATQGAPPCDSLCCIALAQSCPPQPPHTTMRAERGGVTAFCTRHSA